MLGVFAVAAVVSYADRLILNQLVAPIRQDLAIDDLEMSFLQGGAFAVIYVLAGLPLGRLADRMHRLTLIRAGAAIWSLGTIACALAPGFWSLFAGRLVVGIGEAALAPAVVSILGDAFPPARRGTALGAFLMSSVIGVSASVLVGGLLLQAAEQGRFAAWPLLGTLAPWRQALALAGLPGLLVVALLALLREPARRERGSSGSLPEVLRHFIGDRVRLAPIYLGMGVMSIGDFAILTWTPAALERGYGWDPVATGSVFGAIIAGTALAGSLAGGVVSDWAEARGGPAARLNSAMVSAGLGLVAAALLAFGTAPMALVAVTLWLFATSVLGVAAIATLQELLPNELRGVGSSLVSFCNILLGMGLGPSIPAFIADRLLGDPAQIGHAMAAVGVVSAGASVVLFARARRGLKIGADGINGDAIRSSDAERLEHRNGGHGAHPKSLCR